MAGGNLRDTEPGRVQAGLIKWWPLALIGPVVLAIRFPGFVQSLGEWLWLPVGLALVVQLAARRDVVTSSVGVVLFGGFVVYLAVSLLWSPDPARGLLLVGLMGTAFLAFSLGRTAGPPGGSSEVWRAGVVGLGVAVAGFVFVRDPEPVGHLNADRILAMGAIALVVSAWYGPRGRMYTLVVGVMGVGLVIASGSRTAAVVLILLLLTAPGLRLPRAGRFLLLSVVVALTLVLAGTSWFQQRWFVSGEGSLWELVTMQGVDTSGRADVWPGIASSCDRPILGSGAGASGHFGSEINEGFPEPHNEYLRIWCDSGLVGTILFWGFVAYVAARSLAGLRVKGRSWEHYASIQMIAALLLLSLTDNPLTTAIPFMIPAALAFSWSERSYEGSPEASGRGRRHQAPGKLRENGS